MNRTTRTAVSALLFASAALPTACTDAATDDHETCLLRGFEKGSKEYAYCREKLQQIRTEEEERGQRFLELLTG